MQKGEEALPDYPRLGWNGQPEPMHTPFSEKDAHVGIASDATNCGPPRVLKYGTAAAMATRESRLQLSLIHI